MSETRTEPTTRSVEATIEIEASPEAVWRALSDARELERWFPLEARVEPGEGGSVFMSWKNEYAGESRITVWEPGRHLQITWGFSDEEKEITQLTDFHLEGGKGRTILRVVTSGFPEDPSWDAWYEGTRQGWAYELASLKRYLEKHPGQDREVVYLRRRVKLPAEEAWERLGHERSIFDAHWPTWDEALTVEDTVELAVQVNGKTRGKVTVRRDATEAEAVAAVSAEPSIAKFLDGKTVRKTILVPNRLVNLVLG